MLVASTILFIVSIMTREWIIKDEIVRGIFEVCATAENALVDKNAISCSYILTASDSAFVKKFRSDYTIACSSLAIVASSLGIIFIWIAGIYMCVQKEFAKKIITSLVIAGTLLIDCITIVIWIVMLAENLDSNNVITRSQIGNSLWMAVGATGGYLIALVLFCMHRIDLGTSIESTKRQENYTESREYLQRF